MASTWKKLAGTIAQWFGVGLNADIAIGNDGSGNLIFKDEVVVGTKTLTDLLEGGSDDDQVKESVDVGDTFIVKSGHQHILFQRYIIDGVYQIDGTSVILG